MSKKFLLHDLDGAQAQEIFGVLPKDIQLFEAKPMVKHCIGCFGCWLKTPGRCVIQDRCKGTPLMMATSQETIIVSRMVYGGYSPEVKGVLDRSIGYIMPFFRIVNKEMHHTMRYENPFTLTVHFYGPEITAGERSIAEKLVAGNGVNLGAAKQQVFFHESIQQRKEVLG